MSIVQERIDRVMVRLGMRWPFFCQMLASQKLVLADDSVVPTLATNGSSIYINEKFFLEALNDDTQVSGIGSRHPRRNGCSRHT